MRTFTFWLWALTPAALVLLLVMLLVLYAGWWSPEWVWLT